LSPPRPRPSQQESLPSRSRRPTPRLAPSSNNVRINTQDDQDVIIDGRALTTADDSGAFGSTEAIGDGALSGLSFLVTKPEPGWTTVATAAFTAAGRILVGGKIQITMPDVVTNHGVQRGFLFTTPVVDFTPATPTADAAWDDFNRRLTVTVTGTEDVPAGAVSFLITNCNTPSATVPADTASFYTTDATDTHTDGSALTPAGETTGATDAMVPQALTGTLTLDSGTDTPGVTSTGTVAFTTNGQILVGGKIKIVLPDLDEASALGAGQEASYGWRSESAFGIPVAQALPSPRRPASPAQACTISARAR